MKREEGNGRLGTLKLECSSPNEEVGERFYIEGISVINIKNHEVCWLRNGI